MYFGMQLRLLSGNKLEEAAGPVNEGLSETFSLSPGLAVSTSQWPGLEAFPVWLQLEGTRLAGRSISSQGKLPDPLQTGTERKLRKTPEMKTRH